MINYVVGDATVPQGDSDSKIIAHVCNDRGVWGAGFVMALSRKWPGPETIYRALANLKKGSIPMGEVQYCCVDRDPYNQITVANMVAQRMTPVHYSGRLVDYGTLKACLVEVMRHANDLSASLHMPRIGADLGKGDWNVIEKLILEAQAEYPDVDIYVYSLPGSKWTT